MKYRVAFLVWVAYQITALLLIAQEIPSDQLFRAHRWDAGHGVAFFGRGVIRSDSHPIRGYIDGEPRGGPINFFNDFPHLKKALVDDFAAGPNGTTLVAVVLNFGSTLQHVILTYDASGKLTSILDTEPYYAGAITTDEAGNIFTLGSRLDEKNLGKKSYPLLVVYSPKGKVIRRGLDSALFKEGSAAVNEAEIDPSIMLLNSRIYIYAPRENEILVCSKDGTILRRFGLAAVLSEIRRKRGMKLVRLKNVSFVDEHRVVLDVIGYSESDQAHRNMDPSIMHPVAYLVDLAMGSYSAILEGQVPGWNFLGVKGDQLLMLSPEGQHSMQAHNLFK